jgi:hypothetical protein
LGRGKGRVLKIKEVSRIASRSLLCPKDGRYTFTMLKNSGKEYT